MAIATGTALIGSALIGGGLSALSSNKAAKTAANASTKATEESNALQRQMYDTTRADLSPFVQSGVTANNALQSRVSAEGAGEFGNTQNPTYAAPTPFKFDESDYRESPGFAFQMSRGIDAINSSQAARGSMYSGATSKAIAQFAEGLALQDYNNAESKARSYYDTDQNRLRSNYDADRNYLTNRFDTNTNVLQGLATGGQNAAAQVGTAGQNYATSAGNALQQNAANVGNAGLVAAQNNSNLLGQGVNALSYYARPGVVNNLASGGIVPKANSAGNQFSGYAFG